MEATALCLTQFVLPPCATPPPNISGRTTRAKASGATSASRRATLVSLRKPLRRPRPLLGRPRSRQRYLGREQPSCIACFSGRLSSKERSAAKALMSWLRRLLFISTDNTSPLVRPFTITAPVSHSACPDFFTLWTGGTSLCFDISKGPADAGDALHEPVYYVQLLMKLPAALFARPEALVLGG